MHHSTTLGGDDDGDGDDGDDCTTFLLSSTTTTKTHPRDDPPRGPKEERVCCSGGTAIVRSGDPDRQHTPRPGDPPLGTPTIASTTTAMRRDHHHGHHTARQDHRARPHDLAASVHTSSDERDLHGAWPSRSGLSSARERDGWGRDRDPLGQTEARRHPRRRLDAAPPHEAPLPSIDDTRTQPTHGRDAGGAFGARANGERCAVASAITQ